MGAQGWGTSCTGCCARKAARSSGPALSRPSVQAASVPSWNSCRPLRAAEQVAGETKFTGSISQEGAWRLPHKACIDQHVLHKALQPHPDSNAATPYTAPVPYLILWPCRLKRGAPQNQRTRQVQCATRKLRCPEHMLASATIKGIQACNI